MKANASEKFELEVRIRKEVSNELKAILESTRQESAAAIKKTKEEADREAARKVEVFKSRLEEKEMEIKRLNALLASTKREVEAKDQKIACLDQSLFLAQEKACDKSYLKLSKEQELIEVRSEVSRLKEVLAKVQSEKQDEGKEKEKEIKEKEKK